MKRSGVKENPQVSSIDLGQFKLTFCSARFEYPWAPGPLIDSMLPRSNVAPVTRPRRKKALTFVHSSVTS